ncbi:homoprotocatechuate degradation operon regulator HpaR [Celeribacter indicus]|uniref:MarR family transcriptional regulator n=1 Tax=Celeribacter indicus TaxID=1208324 RepID=A0A0B5E088_9RHOB|nr:homoprotocatechuate degradation operon regulator HpaR [Celeribacter indicus]AJE49108.1 MarR family transcriptional regulator [Celeribacter indicus]SDX48624.1 transcriptional regulator, MarR family [Celeribacter indicus]
MQEPPKHGTAPPESAPRISGTLPVALLRAREGVMDRFRPMLAAHDVTEPQWRVLRVLAEFGETEAGPLATRAGLLAPSLTRIMRRLEARGFLHTRREAEDRRRRIVSLTAEGQSFLDRLAPQNARILAEIEEAVGRERIGTLLDEIEDLLAALGAAE